jgi:hypothetical protein
MCAHPYTCWPKVLAPAGAGSVTPEPTIPAITIAAAAPRSGNPGHLFSLGETSSVGSGSPHTGELCHS